MTTTTIKEKSISKLQNAAIKQSAETLAGACKLYCAIFSDSANLKALAKELEIDVVFANTLSKAAKDKKDVLSICQQMLANIDGAFVQPVCIYKVDKVDETNNTTKTAEWQAENIVPGKTFKPFGFASETEIDGGNESGKYFVTQNEKVERRYAYCRINRYSVRLVAKCVQHYLANKPE